MISSLDTFFERVSSSLENGTFIKIVTSDKKDKKSDLKSISIKRITIKSGERLSFTYRHATKDIVRNYDYLLGIDELKGIISHSFGALELFTMDENTKVTHDSEGKTKVKIRAPEITEAPELSHDKQKKRYIKIEGNRALQELGVLNDRFEVIPSMQDKFKQIDKFLEIIDGLLKQAKLPKNFRVADMGSGKWYLTFALYDYLANTLKLPVEVSGIEFRSALVDFCNEVARKVGFKGLIFQAGTIAWIEENITLDRSWEVPEKRSNSHEARAPEWVVRHSTANEEADRWMRTSRSTEIPHDIIIALHACDTATDDAIYQGIISSSRIIICSPCCHKQIRKQLLVSHDLKSILRNGILEERQAEIATDGIRALLMEAHGYETKVFEYISSEHTGKNLMITGVKTGKKTDSEKILAQVDEIKKLFGIKEHYLEKLLKEKKS